ncbi:MAG: hypothetical protein A07HB70_00713, partial [uncultured archaeon A07HB70]
LYSLSDLAVATGSYRRHHYVQNTITL